MKYCLVLAALLLAACSSKDDVFDKSPSQRSSESITALKAELVNAPYGWRVLYFPKTDSLLFSNPSELISQHGFRGHYGGDIQVTSDTQETVFSGTVPKDTTIPEAKAAQENSPNA